VLIVKTPVLRWLGIASIGFGFLISPAVTGGWLHVALCWAIFGAAGVSLLLLSATIEATEETITVRRVFSTAQVRWSDITSASLGGGNFVIYSANGRLSMPSMEFWGTGRRNLAVLVDQKLKAAGVTIRWTVRAAVHVNSRSPNKSLERTRER
jgi:PH (Pleckstrin Homology) domain-containing protein